MDHGQKNKWLVLAVAGLASGLAACGSSPPPAAPAAGQPSEAKHACKAAGDKNGCGGHEKAASGDSHEHSPSEGSEHEKAK